MSWGITTGLVLGQVVGAMGCVVFAGLLMFRVLVLPEPGRPRIVAQLSIGGLILTTVSALVHLIVAVINEPAGTSREIAFRVVLVQLGAVVAAACYVPDLVSHALVGWRRMVGMATSVLLAVTLLLPILVDRGQPALVPDLLAVIHILSLCTLAGGVVVVALIALPFGTTTTNKLTTMKILLRRSRVTDLVLLAILLISGVLLLVDEPNRIAGVSGAFWVLLALKAVLFALLIATAAHVRQQFHRAAFRSEHMGDDDDALGSLRRVVTVEIAIAAAAVAATAVLTVLTPLT